jgi:hypothetical protein
LIVALNHGSAFRKITTMSHSASHPVPATSAAAEARLSFPALLTALGAIVLIGSEIWLAAVATIWAADGVLGLSIAGDLVLAAMILPLSIWATWMVIKLAIAAERDPDNTL